MVYFGERIGQFKNIAELLKSKNPLQTIEKLLEDKAQLEKRIEALEQKEISFAAKQLAQDKEIINGIQFVGKAVDVNSADALKKMCFSLKQELENYVAVLVANIDGKANVAILLDDHVVDTKGLDAGKIIKEHIAGLIKGGGGGQKTLATAGGQDVSQLAQVIEVVKSLL